MPHLALHWRSFLVPKDGNAENECEDAVAGDPASGRFAIADGASESYASGDWARLLVDAYVTTGPSENWLTAPQVAWKKQTVGSALSWYAEEKFTHGGHATFLGLTVRKDEDSAEWEAIAAGDTCLFVVSHGAILTSFPLSKSTEFSSTPTLLSSRGGKPTWIMDRGTLCSGDVMVLATDALGRFLFESSEKNAFAGRDLIGMEDEDDFALWVAATRATGSLKNDDVALGVIEIV
jgi:hypothetical protein